MTFDFNRYRSLLRSTGIGVEVAYADVVESTMDAARAGAAAGRPPGSAYVAGEQRSEERRVGKECRL